MSLFFYKKPVLACASALATLLQKYKTYGDNLEYPENEEELYEKATANVSLLQSALTRIKTAVSNLQEKIDKMENQFANAKKADQKELMLEVQEIEKESQFSQHLATAEVFMHMLEAQLSEARVNLTKAQRKLKLPSYTDSVGGDSTQSTSGASRCHESSEDAPNHDLTSKMRSVKPPNISLPKFFGNEEEFPEYWAVYESLIHSSNDLSVIEKIILLKDSLRGKAEKAIKGIQPIAKNYDWIINTLIEKFGNQPANRSKIVQKLFDLEVAASNAISCDDRLDSIKALINQMVSTGYDIRLTTDPMWTETIIKKFPFTVIKDVVAQYQDNKNITIGDLMKALEKEISSKLFVETHWGSNCQQLKETKISKDYKIHNQKPSQICVFCGRSNHLSIACRTITDIQRRREIAKEKRLCWKCFHCNHSSNQCNKPNCPHCGQKHHPSICLANRPFNGTRPPPANTRPTRNEVDQQNYGNRQQRSDNRYSNRSNNDTRRTQQTNTQLLQNEQENDRSTLFTNCKNEQLILMTAEGNVWNNKTQNFEKVLFFFDTGAHKSIIEEKLAEDFGLPKLSTETCVMSGIGGHIERFESAMVPLKVMSAYGREINFTVQTKPVITGGFPSVKLSQKDAEFLENHQICIANSKLQGERQTPKILVGLDRYYDLVLEDGVSKSTPSGLRIAQTFFGPAIYGRGRLDCSEEQQTISFGLTAIVENSENRMLENLFELEGLGISPDECALDDKVQQYFEDYVQSISFNHGYVTAPFPLKSNISQLQDNYPIAIRRLASLQNQLKQNREQSHWYSQILEGYRRQGIIEQVFDKDENAVGIYYMPHSGVWRPQKTTPLRIVFDASSKKKGQLSLNEVIHKGESFVNKIHEILISSRFSKYILLCDIEAAFTQIRLKDAHKDLCRFLWVKDINRPVIRSNIIEYRFNRLPFGITASPSVLNMALLAYLRSTGTQLSTEISRNLYVDNILLHAQTEEEIIKKYKESKTLFSKIGMNLREYVSNSETANSAIPEIDRSDPGEMKILGVSYNTRNDRFTVRTKFEMKQFLTKREVVKQINGIYDPLGVVAPLIIELKSLMREIFAIHSGWDDRVGSELHQKWNTLCSSVNNAEITIPRALVTDNTKSLDACLYAFADASKAAIATCAYIAYQNNTVTQLVSGKTKLSPKKAPQTIPRLELLGILIALRLGNNILQTDGCFIKKLIVASDSEIALCWIRSERKLPLFVANQRRRILALKEELEKSSINVRFVHVPTLLNPADAGTRGLKASQLKEHSWITGPRWITYENTAQLRPADEIYVRNNEYDSEITEVPHIIIGESNETTPLVEISRFSNLKTLLRTVARVGKGLRQWVDLTNSRAVVDINPVLITKFDSSPQISAIDLNLAEKLLIQNLHGGVSLEDLQRRFPNQRIVRDPDGIIRQVSRLQNSALPPGAKTPIYLSNKDYFTKLVLRDVHRSNAHIGKNHTLSIIGQRFWVPRPSSAYKNAVKDCVICRRWQGMPFGAPEMPPLPTDRVLITKPFANSACDFMGPFPSKSGETMYVCLYTCLTIRAVHLEVVEDLSTGAFLNSFTRLISRRGVPHLMRSDCGSNFKLGSRMISDIFKNESTDDNSLMTFCASNGIKWIFNPPASPWMGGVWERLVGSVKKCLQKSVGRKKLSFCELSTAMAKIEAILNTRPLTKLDSSDITEIPLRPIDFLQGNVSFSLPNTDTSNCEDESYDPDVIQTVKQAKEALKCSENIAVNSGKDGAMNTGFA